MHLQLFICTLLNSDDLTQAITQLLGQDNYLITHFKTEQEFLAFATQQQQQLDCLLVQERGQLVELIQRLRDRKVLLPTIVLQTSDAGDPETEDVTAPHPKTATTVNGNVLEAFLTPEANTSYYPATIWVPMDQISQIGRFIDRAIAQFLKLSSQEVTRDAATLSSGVSEATKTLLMLQQQRLSERLRERLGYLGVYYKRDSRNFFRNLSSEEKQEFLVRLKQDYHDIVLYYFAKDSGLLNQKIDTFVNMMFFADISVSQIVEIHMELMDDFSKQLRLEGRSEDILLDYRLTLIDTIAHLCEMYRRSIPREN